MKRTGPFLLKRDDLKLGLILGFITPIVIFFIIYFLRFSGYAFNEYMRTFFRERSLITFFGVWCLVGNIALFTIYINTRKDRTARGIFAITLLYGIGVLLLKVFQ